VCFADCSQTFWTQWTFHTFCLFGCPIFYSCWHLNLYFRTIIGPENL
jgi:hypothetical protein